MAERYDLLLYDVGESAGRIKDRRVYFYAELTASVGIAEELSRSYRIEGVLGTNVEMNPCWFRFHPVECCMNSDVSCNRNMYRNQSILSTLGQSINIVKVMRRKIERDIGLYSDVDLSKIESRIAGVSSGLVSSASIGFLKKRAVVQDGALNAFVDVMSISEQIATIGVTIPAGKILRIDTENCTVYLDNVSVFKFYEGDWFEISREAILISVDSGTGGQIDGLLSYVERYL